MLKSISKVKKRQKSISQLKEEVWQVFSKYIRMRDCLESTGCKDWGLCITCYKRYHIKLLQAGHFIPGRHNANLFSERGTHAQCYNCNINLMGNSLQYRRRIIEMYGEGYDEVLEDEAQEIVKFTKQDLEEKLKYYSDKIKELER